MSTTTNQTTHVATRAVEVRGLAEHFGIDEGKMLDLLLNHEEEISDAVARSVLEIVEELGFLDGCIPMTDPHNPHAMTRGAAVE